jgi:hypothetical protein
MRQRTSLDGRWRFWPDVGSVLDQADHLSFVSEQERTKALGEPRPALVPRPWQAQFEDLRLWSGVAWYERAFTAPPSWAGRRVRLLFGSVDYLCSAWVNGKLAGTHEGGYVPFEFDVGAALRPGGSNTVTLRVADPGPGWELPRLRFAEIPHGKQSWYGPLGGIWQSVFLEASSARIVRRVAAHGDPSARRARLWVELDGGASEGETVECRVASPDRTRVASRRTAPLHQGAEDEGVEVEVGDPELWDVDAPRLYEVETALVSPDGREIDARRDRFGFRSFEARSGDILLNGRPLYVLGALDQDYYLGSISAPPSDEVVGRQFGLAKELGLNLVRCHIKVPDPRYLGWADRLGVLVWSELPSWGTLSEDSKARARATMEGMIRRDFNHPSIVIWTIVNESWGLDVASNDEHRRWLAETFAWVKALDPTRLVVDNSPCEPNFHVISDLNDFHFYRCMPDQTEQWSAWTASWARAPESSYSPHGDARLDGGEPLVLSEFGNWGLPDVANLVDADGREPWWFDTGGERIPVDFLAEGIQQRLEDTIVRPRGVRERFHEWSLEEVFGSWAGFVNASQEHQFESLGYEIQDVRRHEEIRGYVITELTDCHWECNGLLDMARGPKSYHARFTEINSPDVVIAVPERRRYASGEHASISVFASHFSDARLDGGHVAWAVPELGLRGSTGGVSLARGTTVEVGCFGFRVPALERPLRARVEASLRDALGAEINRTDLALLLFPEEPRGAPFTEVRVEPRWDQALDDHVASGGRAVVVATQADALPQGASIHVVARAKTKWEGDWAQGMGWLRRELRSGLPLLARVDLTWEGMNPRHVVLGYAPEAARDVLAGYYVGWIHATAATIAAFRHGAGAALACTFPLLDVAADPLARALLRRLVELAAAPELAPTTSLFSP